MNKTLLRFEKFWLQCNGIHEIIDQAWHVQANYVPPIKLSMLLHNTQHALIR